MTVKFSYNRSILIPAVILAFLFLIGLVPQLVTSREPLKSGYTAGLSAPSREFPLGTDQLGRDIFAWVVHGTRFAFYVGTVCTLISFAVALLGMFAGYFLSSMFGRQHHAGISPSRFANMKMSDNNYRKSAFSRFRSSARSKGGSRSFRSGK